MTARRDTMAVCSYMALAILCFLVALTLFLLLPVKPPGSHVSLRGQQASIVELSSSP